MTQDFHPKKSQLPEHLKKKLLPDITAILCCHVGRRHAITNNQIIKKLGIVSKEQDAYVRKVINYIRTQGTIQCLIAGSRGYFVAVDAKEITDYEETLRSREAAIRDVRESIHAQGVAAFGDAAMQESTLLTNKEREDQEIRYQLKLKVRRTRKVSQKRNKKRVCKRKRKNVLRLKIRKHY